MKKRPELNSLATTAQVWAVFGCNRPKKIACPYSIYPLVYITYGCCTGAGYTLEVL